MQVLAGPPSAAGARQPSPVAEMIEVVGPTYAPWPAQLPASREVYRVRGGTMPRTHS
jgi:hypothetical protein